MALPPPCLRKMKLQHRSAVLLCLGIPRTSQVDDTLAETGAWPLSLPFLQQGLRRDDRLHHAADGQALLARLRSRRASQMGRLRGLYEHVIADTPANAAQPPSPPQPPVPITTDLPGVSKRCPPADGCLTPPEEAWRSPPHVHRRVGDAGHGHIDSSLHCTCSAEEQAVPPSCTSKLHCSGGGRPPPCCRSTRRGAAIDTGSYLRFQGGPSSACRGLKGPALGSPCSRPGCLLSKKPAAWCPCTGYRRTWGCQTTRRLMLLQRVPITPPPRPQPCCNSQ